MLTRFTILSLLQAFVLASTLALTMPATSQAGDMLDGMEFVAMIDGEEDHLIFADGTFFSSACEEWGFGKAPYTTTSKADGTAFETTVLSDKHGKMVWTGMVTEDKIKGKYVWTKEGWFRTKTKTKEFTGSLKK